MERCCQDAKQSPVQLSPGYRQLTGLFRTMWNPFFVLDSLSPLLPSHGTLPTLAYLYVVPLKGFREGKVFFFGFIH